MSFAAVVDQESQESSNRVVAPPALEIFGAEGAPAILALGGISADRHVCRTDRNPAPGWWDGAVGPSAAIDTRRYRVIGGDYIGQGHVTTHDQARALACALDAAGIPALHALVGASYGGMVALAFAELFPERVERLIVIGAAHRSAALTSARRLVQRRIVELGIETARTQDALALARALALTTYRSDAELESRFGTGDTTDLASLDSWLQHHGDKFARRFSAERYLALSRSSDLHLVDPARISTPATLIALQGDGVVPVAHVRALARGFGAPVRFVELPTLNGHDAFLTDTDALAPIIRDALEARLS